MARELLRRKQNIIRPGQMYIVCIVDPTTFRFNLSNEELEIKPTICFLMDAFSRLIAGVHVGYGSICWEDIKCALYNCTEDKVIFCRENGLDITAEQWPTTMLPSEINVSRMVLLGKAPVELPLKITTDISDRYLNNIVAQFEKSLYACEARTNNTESAVKNHAPKEYGRGPLALCVKEIMDFTLKFIVWYNNEFKSSYALPKEIDNGDIRVTPSRAWELGIEHWGAGSYRLHEDDTIRFLLCASRAKLVEDSICFKGLKYSTTIQSMEKLQLYTKESGSKYIDIRYNPRDIDKIYLLVDGGIETCFLKEEDKEELDSIADNMMRDRRLPNEPLHKEKKMEIQKMKFKEVITARPKKIES